MMKLHPLISDLPKNVKDFLKRALFIFIIWKLTYHLLLFPIRVPDRQLTNLTAYSTTLVYTLLMKNSVAYQREEIKPPLAKGQNPTKMTVIYVNDKRSVGIADGCNGLELYVLYSGFLLCFPFTLVRKITFILIGIISIFVLNTFRCFGLTYLFVNDYPFADFAHHYLFKIVIYAIIFFTWTQYVRPVTRKNF